MRMPWERKGGATGALAVLTAILGRDMELDWMV